MNLKSNLCFSIALFLFLDLTIVEFKQYYKGYGVIFHSNHKALEEYKKYSDTFFTPKVEDVKKAEEILSNDYYNYLIEYSNKTKIYNSSDSKYKRKKNVIKKYYNFNRQYFGFIKDGDSCIQIKLHNFSDKEFEEMISKHYKERIIHGFGDFYYKNQDSFIINLTKNQVKVPIIITSY